MSNLYYLTLILGWMIWPGLFFIVALVFESRVPPIGQHQSKAFLPGDFFLVLMVVNAHFFWSSEYAPKPGSLWYYIFVPNWDRHLLSWIGVIVCVFAPLIIYPTLTARDHANYPWYESCISPTKQFHDIFGYLIIPFLFIGMGGIPMLIPTEANVYSVLSWGCLLLYVALVTIDSLKGASKEDMYLRHPYDWQPIWRTGKIIKYQYHTN